MAPKGRKRAVSAKSDDVEATTDLPTAETVDDPAASRPSKRGRKAPGKAAAAVAEPSSVTDTEHNDHPAVPDDEAAGAGPSTEPAPAADGILALAGAAAAQDAAGGSSELPTAPAAVLVVQVVETTEVVIQAVAPAQATTTAAAEATDMEEDKPTVAAGSEPEADAGTAGSAGPSEEAEAAAEVEEGEGSQAVGHEGVEQPEAEKPAKRAQKVTAKRAAATKKPAAAKKPAATKKPAAAAAAPADAAAAAPAPPKAPAASRKRAAKEPVEIVAGPRHRAPAAAAAAKVPAVRRHGRAAEAAAAAAAATYDVFTMGSSDFGALGLGEDTKERYRPAHVALPDGERAVQVSCGGVHTAVLTISGNVFTFGVNDEGALGRPTEGTPWRDKPDAKEDDCTPGRMRLPAGVVAKQVAAGDGLTFVLAADGSVWGCGCFKDELGGHDGFAPGGLRLAALPVCVWQPESLRDKGVKLVCGARHAVLLTARGSVFTWGIGSQGQLGRFAQFNVDSLPTPDALFTPTDVTLGVVSALGASPIVDIAAGAYTTFAINRSGAVAAAGLNNSGQLGIPKENDDDNIKWEFESVDIPKVSAVEGGEYHTLAMTRDGTVLSFGAASYGCLGREGLDLATNNANHPKPEPVAGVEGQVVSLAAGQHVSACVTADGGAWLWGSNNTFQLGRGDDDSNVPVPEKLKRTKVFGFRKIVRLSFGGQHAALLAGAPEEQAAPAAAAAAAAPAAAPAAEAAAPAAAAPADSVPAVAHDAAPAQAAPSGAGSSDATAAAADGPTAP